MAYSPAETFMALSYEDLMAEPQERLRELAEFIGVTAPSAWLRAGAAALDPRRAGAAARLPQPDLDKYGNGASQAKRPWRPRQPARHGQSSHYEKESPGCAGRGGRI